MITSLYMPRSTPSKANNSNQSGMDLINLRNNQLIRNNFSSQTKAAKQNKTKTIYASKGESLPIQSQDKLSQKYERLQTSYNTPLQLFSLSGQRDVASIFQSLQQAGFPIYDNGILLPENSPGQWNLHYKPQETQIIEQYRQHLGQKQDSLLGYVCTRSEANQFGIRTLMEGLEKAYPKAKPILIASQDGDTGIDAAHKRFSLPYRAIPTDQTGAMDLDLFQQTLQTLPKNAALLIVISSLTRYGGKDNKAKIAELCQAQGLPYAFHLDCSYDFLHTLQTNTYSEPMGLPDAAYPERIGSITAGGLTFQEPPICAVLCAKSLAKDRSAVQYIRGSDKTLSGSRPAIQALKMWLVQQAFDKQSYINRETVITTNCQIMQQALASLQIDAEHIAGTGWLRFTTSQLNEKTRSVIAKVGGLINDKFTLLQISPLLDDKTAYLLLRNLANSTGQTLPNSSWWLSPLTTYTPPKLSQQCNSLLKEFAKRSDKIREQSMGYPGNQATMAQISPLVAPYLHHVIPEQATEQNTNYIINQLSKSIAQPYPTNRLGMLTSGGTEAIAAGLINALSYFQPNEAIHVYISDQAHYCVARIARDNLRLTNSVRMIKTTKDGAIDPQHFLKVLMKDTRQAQLKQVPMPRCILVCTYETTFSGSYDKISDLYSIAKQNKRTIDYIHLDGALGLGHSLGDISLFDVGQPPPDKTTFANSVSISLHKFPGLQVGGALLAAAPPQQQHLIHPKYQTDPMAALLGRIYLDAYPEQKRQELREICQANTAYLRNQLISNQVKLQHALPKSIITTFSSPPIWVEDKFNLANENGLTHIVTMPHVTKELINTFIGAFNRSTKFIQMLENALNETCQEFLPHCSMKILTTRRPFSKPEQTAMQNFWARLNQADEPRPFQSEQDEEIFILLTQKNTTTIHAMAIQYLENDRLYSNDNLYIDDTIPENERAQLIEIIELGYEKIQAIISQE